jgi:hypothetical protein
MRSIRVRSRCERLVRPALLTCFLLACPWATAQTSAPGPSEQSSPTTGPASDLQDDSLQNQPLEDAQKEQYITAVTTAHRDRPAASVSLRREISLALDDVNRRYQAAVEQGRKQIATAQIGRDTANASRRGGKGWYGGQMEQVYSQKIQQEQRENQAALARLAQERATLTAQLGRLDTLDRLYTDAKEVAVDTQYGQMRAAALATRRADADYRNTVMTGPASGKFGPQLFTLAAGIRKEYEKRRGPQIQTATQPENTDTKPGS